jgi:hypothetical protein
LFLLLLLLPKELLFILLSPFILLDHGVSVRSGLSTHAEVKEIVEIIGVLAQRGNVKLNLTIELRNKGAMK